MEQNKKCPACGQYVLAVARKCKYCGHWFDEEKSSGEDTRRCPVCDEIISKDVPVCPFCNEPVENEPVEPVPDEMQAEEVQTLLHESESSTESDMHPNPPIKKIEALFIGIGAILTLVVIAVAIWMIVISLQRVSNADAPLLVPTETTITEGDSAKAVAEKWNTYHQQLDADALASLYGDKVYYYHEYYTPEKIVQNKRELFRKYPEFWQNIYNVECTFTDSGAAKVTFSKEVTTTLAGKTTTYPSYLIMNKIGDKWKITTESDEVTDANIAKRKKR